MHMQGEPGSMQDEPRYEDVVTSVRDFLREREQAVAAAGVAPGRIVLDPGIGFGKTPVHNLELLRRQAEIAAPDRPLLVGWSRKSTLGLITGRSATDRVSASVAAALLSVQAGARIVRVHDVAATVDAIKVWRAINNIDEDAAS
jgi:dihydropteroate synthase